ncbi:MAG: glycosyltransferase [Patescibacteria group bacterium]
MKILHYINTFSKPSETFVYDQITNLENEGVNNYILTQKRVLKKERPFNENKIYITKERKRYTTEKALHKIFYWRKYNLRNPKKFLKVINEVNPDVIHAHFGNNGIFIKKILEKYDLNIPLIISFHGTDITSKPALDFTYRQEIKNLKTYPHLICTAHTNFLKNKLIEYEVPENKIEMLTNTYNKNFSKARKESFFNYGDTFKIVNTARFINWKGHKYLLEAFKKLVDNFYSNSELTFLGDGDTRKEMENLAEKMNIKEKVNFMGMVEHQKIPEILKDHDVYVQPSIIDPDTYQREGSPISVLEPITVGLPVIVTNTGGMPETVLEDNQQFSFIVPEKDPDAIYQIFKRMISNEYQFRDNKEYAQRVMNKFSPEKNINKTIDIYKKIAKK